MSVWELYTQLFARNRRCGRFAQSLSQGCSEKIRKKDIVMTAGRWSSWSIQIPQFLMLWWPAMKAGSTAMTQRPRDRVPSGSTLALPDPRRPDRTNPSTNFDDPFFWQHWHDLHALGSHWTVTKEYYVEVLRQFRKKFLEKRPALFKYGQWTMHQSTIPALSQTIWPRWVSRQFLTLPIVQTLLPVTFAYSLSSEAVTMRQFRIWKRLWRKSLTHLHKMTSMGPSRGCWNGTTSALHLGEITSKGTRVSCVYYQ